MSLGSTMQAASTIPLSALVGALVCTMTGWPWPAMAAPTGGVVTRGAASINQTGAVTTIDQVSQTALIKWQGFGIKPAETVIFHQPAASAITVNTVIGNERSVIEGVLKANGRVFLINANGVLFAPGSSVQTAGLVASTLTLSDEDFDAGSYVFRANGHGAEGTGSVINQGTIAVTDGGHVALLGQEVANQGVIVARLGTVVLAAGERIRLNFNGDSLLSVSIEQGALNALVENRHAIIADGGKVILSAKAADELLGAQVNNSGLVQARTIGDLKGEIVVHADGGETRIDGTLDASAAQEGDGGFIETSGQRVQIADSAVITTASSGGQTGHWLIDPVDFTIAASGGDMTGAGLSSRLELNNVDIRSGAGMQTGQGDIHVNDAVSWHSDTTLALAAEHDIHINAAISASGEEAGLALNHGGWNGSSVLAPAEGSNYHLRTKASYSGAERHADGELVARQDSSGGVYGSVTLSGAKAALSVNGQRVTLIHNLDELATTGTASGMYALAQDIDASAWSASHTGAASVVNTLGGTLAGMGHSISHLTLNRLERLAYVGLIGTANGGATIRDIGLEGVNITGTGGVGALSGRTATSGATVINSYATGSVNGNSGVGGLIGNAAGNTTRIIGSYADVALSTGISPGAGLGGLLGVANGRVVIDQSHALGSVTSGATVLSQGAGVGGLVGSVVGNDTASVVSYSYASGAVAGPAQVGGLIGKASGTADSPMRIDHSFATGAVTSTLVQGGKIGGLIGSIEYTQVDNAHAASTVTGILDQTQYVGGLIGWVGLASSVSGSYANTTVTVGTNGVYAGGLVGYLGETSSITGSYSTGKVSGTPITTISNVKGIIETSPGLAMGGLVGLSFGAISDAWSSVDVIGEGGIGGLVGHSYGPVQHVETWGDVSSGSGPVGGVIGALDGGPLDDFKVHGNVRGVDGVGGAVGGTLDAHIGHGLIDGTVFGIGEGIGWVTGVARGTLSMDEVHWQGGSGPGAALGVLAENLSYCAARGVCGETTTVATANVNVLPPAPTTVGKPQDATPIELQADVSKVAASQSARAQPQPASPSAFAQRNLVAQALERSIVISRSVSAGVGGIEVDGVMYDLDEMDATAAGNGQDEKKARKP